MATCASYASTVNSTNATSYALTAFTPAVDDLLVVCIGTSNSVEPTAAGALTDNQSGTYYLAHFSLRAASGSSNYIFVRNQKVSSAVSHTLTFTCTGDASGGIVAFPYGVAGMSKTGSNAVKQVAKQDNQGAGGTPAPAFSASALTGNVTIGFVGNGSSPAGLTPPTSWTEPTTPSAFDAGYSTPTAGGESCFRNSGFTGTTITWGGTSATAFGSLIIELDTSSAGYTLTAAAGSYTLTGNAASLRFSHLLTASAGSYTLTGSTATLSKGYKTITSAGSFALTGNATGLLWGHTLAAGAGAYTLTGSTVILSKGYKIATSPGVYVLTGADVTFRRTYILVTSAGVFVETGTAALLKWGHLLVAGAGSYTLTGVNANLLWNHKLITDAGVYTLTGINATLTRQGLNHYTLVTAAGNYVLNGLDVTLIYVPPFIETGSGRRNKKTEWWREFQEQVTTETERYDMLKSEALALQLEQARKEADAAKRQKSVLAQQNQQLMDVVSEMKTQAGVMVTQGTTLLNQVNMLTSKPQMDPQKKEELLERLEKGRQVQAAKRAEEDAKAKQRLKNLAKARRVKAKNKKGE